MVQLLYQLLLLSIIFITAVGQYATTVLNPLPYALADGYEGIDIQNVQDYCYLRRDDRSGNPDSNKMKLLNVKYLNENLYNVTIWISGQQIRNPGLLESLSITEINGPVDRVAIYNPGFIDEPGEILLPDFITTFQSYGVEKNDTTWLPHFQLRYTYTDGLEGSLSSSHDTTLGVGCSMVDSSLSGYYWEAPASSTNPIVSNDFPTSNTISTPSQTRARYTPAAPTTPYTEIHDVQDYCFLRRDDRPRSPDSNRMKLLTVKYLNNTNLYNVTIWVGGQQISDPSLLESLSITGINGPNDRVAIYNPGFINQPGKILPDFIATFQSYGVEKNDTTWLPHFRLTYTYINGSEGSLSSSHDTTLGVGCMIVDSSLSGYYWKTPASNTDPVVSHDFPISHSFNTPSHTKASCRVPTSTSAYTDIYDVQDYCYLRRTNRRGNPDSNRMKLLRIRYLNTNLYNVTIWIGGQQVSDPGLLESLSITGINGPEDRVTIYNHDLLDQPGEIFLPDFITTFQSYGVEKNDTIWLPYFQLTFTYTDGLEGSLSSSHDTNLGIGCSMVDSSLSGYYWKSPDTFISTFADGTFIVSNCATSTPDSRSVSEPHTSSSTVSTATSTPAVSAMTRSSEFNAPESTTDTTTRYSQAGFATTSFDTRTSSSDNSKFHTVGSTMNSVTTGPVRFTTTNSITTSPKTNGERSSMSKSNTSGPVTSFTTSTPATFVTNNSGVNIPGFHTNESCTAGSTVNSTTAASVGFSTTSIIPNTTASSGNVSSATGFTMNFPTSAPARFTTTSNIVNSSEASRDESSISKSNTTGPIVEFTKSRPAGFVTSLNDISTSGFDNSKPNATASTVNSTTPILTDIATTSAENSAPNSYINRSDAAGFALSSATSAPTGLTTTNSDNRTHKSYSNMSSTAGFIFNSTISTPAVFTTTNRNTSISENNNDKSNAIGSNLNSSASKPTRFSTTSIITNIPGSDKDKSNTANSTMNIPTSRPAGSVTTVRVTDSPGVNSNESNITGSTKIKHVTNTPKSSSNDSISMSSNVNFITRSPLGSAITSTPTNVLGSNSSESNTVGFTANSATSTPVGFVTTNSITNFEAGSNKSSTCKPTATSFTVGPFSSALTEFATTSNVTNIPVLNNKESNTPVPSTNPAVSTLARLMTTNSCTYTPRSSGDGSYIFDFTVCPTTSPPTKPSTTAISSTRSYLSKFSTKSASLEPFSGEFSSSTYSSLNIDTRPTGFQAGTTNAQPMIQISSKNSSNIDKLSVSPIKTVTSTVTTTVLGGCMCPPIEDPKEAASANAD